MKKRITKRDILFFILGLLTMYAIEVATNWNAHKKAFMEGYNGTRETEAVK
ncbi:hypothetical protein ACXR6G_02290 [Ancylomarina sp. YFZ004]